RRRGRGEQPPETADASEGTQAGERLEAPTQPVAAIVTPVAAADPQEVPASEPAPSKRRRRRRSSNGQGGGSENQGDGAETQGGGTEGQGAAGESQGGRAEGQGAPTEREGARPPEVAVETGSPTTPQPASSNEPRPSPFSGGGQDAGGRPEPRSWPVEEQRPEDSGAGGPEAGGLGRVFRRLRRP
ncbi:MAG: hypothetical protein JF922_19460, partial [Candidatus Dormibacteraeota bacterium]|nr:hypothetical protein [Candidatus Dormibacteraeota bacterium]